MRWIWNISRGLTNYTLLLLSLPGTVPVERKIYTDCARLTKSSSQETCRKIERTAYSLSRGRHSFIKLVTFTTFEIKFFTSIKKDIITCVTTLQSLHCRFLLLNLVYLTLFWYVTNTHLTKTTQLKSVRASVLFQRFLVILTVVILTIGFLLLLVTFKGRRTLLARNVVIAVVVVAATAGTMILLIDNTTTHFVWCFSAFLRKNNFNLASLDVKMIHFFASFRGHFCRGIFNKGETFWLLRMIITRNVHVP